ncbi:ribokinase [Ktedonosporobacter rubrisoli]|uniref:Ribokinase n=1 Tax=Ktedonosporobacter rubrisoli TaxID=2509675 RepID=A0A4P6JTE7_KTERU|nr:PfkB family carbohydrate kinase [Ktedonosporobacter rubrisoli]QBD78714.1 ribokinase [Ktedonosporobacter rubrisoli]
MPETNWDLVVVGGAYIDYVVRGERLPEQGETVVGDDFLMTPGGKGANQAVAAARLGARVALVARVGQDKQGDEIIASFKDEHVDTRYIVRDKQASTGMSLIQVNPHGRKQMMVALGACHNLTVADVQAAHEALQTTRCLLTQLEVPLPVARAGVQIGYEAGVRVLFDPAPPVPLPDELLSMVDIIKPDTKEAQVITGVAVSDRESASEAARQLLARGVKIAAVQAGEQGDLLLWRNGECWLPRIPVKSVDATGAGDTFVAALAVALAQGHNLNEAGPFASAAAALATTKFGARPALPRREEVLALCSQQAARR